jgi:hypothetical protein
LVLFPYTELLDATITRLHPARVDACSTLAVPVTFACE